VHVPPPVAAGQSWFDVIVCSITYQTSHVLVVCLFFLSTSDHMSPASGGFAFRPPPGLCPWTPLGDFRPPAGDGSPPAVCPPLSKFLATPLLRDAIFRKRCDMELRRQLITNRKSYMGFRLQQKSMTLNDLELQFTTLSTVLCLL